MFEVGHWEAVDSHLGRNFVQPLLGERAASSVTGDGVLLIEDTAPDHSASTTALVRLPAGFEALLARNS